MRAETKLAWWHLFNQAGGVERSISITAAAVGAAQGASDRSGRRALEALAEHGLIRLPPAPRYKGQFTVYINDPAIVAKARLASAANLSDQGELEFPLNHESLPQEAEEPAAEVLSLPPRSVPADLTQEPPADLVQDPPQDPPSRIHRSAHARAIDSSLSYSSTSARQDEYEATADLVQDPPKARPAAWRDRLQPMERRAIEQIERQRKRDLEAVEAEPLAAAETFTQVVRKLPTPAEQASVVARMAGQLLERIADPAWGQMPTDRQTGLRGDRILLRIAWAIVEGKIAMAKIDTIFLYLNRNDKSGKLSAGRAAYFMGAIKREFAAVGLSWQRREDLS